LHHSQNSTVMEINNVLHIVTPLLMNFVFAST